MRADLTALSADHEALKQSADYFDVADPSKLYIKQLEQPVSGVLKYQVAIPRDTKIEIRLSTSSGGTSATLCGPSIGYRTPAQYRVSVYFQEFGDELHLCIDPSEGRGFPTYGMANRLDFLNDKTSSVDEHNSNFNTRELDATSASTLYYVRESPENQSSGIDLGYLKISVHPYDAAKQRGPASQMQ